ncbi:MAG: fumarate/nitrate reduction transcriptional regulator Fnr [Pseudomonadales bacterium]|nr:fumarate/nitrate reduction transcriptional regulator Fnr [Pseudomonadales bacterium]
MALSCLLHYLYRPQRRQAPKPYEGHDMKDPKPELIPTGNSDLSVPRAACGEQKVVCGLCSLSRLCLPLGLRSPDMEKLDASIVRHRPLDRGRHLFQRGDPFTAIYAVRSGCVKTYVLTKAGKEHIRAFHLPGDIIGLDAIDAGHYPSSARVLQASGLCELPFDRLDLALAQAPSLQNRLLDIMSRALRHEASMALLVKAPAAERLAAFLCSLSQRYAERGYSAREFILGMPRHAIGNYLGLTEETVCRMFTRLQKSGLLSTRGKQVHIHKPGELHDLAGLPWPVC